MRSMGAPVLLWSAATCRRFGRLAVNAILSEYSGSFPYRAREQAGLLGLWIRVATSRRAPN